MKMKLSSLKKYKLVVIVICMLAAGICYSCRGLSSTQGEPAMDLGAEKSDDQEVLPHIKGEQEAFEVEETAAESPDNSDGEKAATGIEDELPVVQVFVHVCGQVKEPGVYELPEGSRVYEAIRVAGGFTGEAAGDYLNLAQEVLDGMKLEVPDREQAELWKSQGQWDSTASAYMGSPDGDSAKVNINTASREELMSLKGIGESRAEDIIRYRERFGGFKSIDDIMNVPGIKEAAFEKIKDSITI